MSTALDERLHRYFDDLPPLNGPGTPQGAMARARSRHRHQVVGLVGCIVLVLAGLGIAGATLLDDDSTPEPVVVEPDGDPQSSEGQSGQRWLVHSHPYEGMQTTWQYVHMVDDDSVVGLVQHLLVRNTPPEDGPTGAREVWRLDGEDHTVIDTGLDSVVAMTRLDEQLWVAGSHQGQLTFAVSDDDGSNWRLRHTGGPTETRTDVGLEAGSGFVIMRTNGFEPGTLIPNTTLTTFAPGSEMGPVATTTVDDSTFWMRSTGGSVIVDGFAESGPLQTTDGREWFELDPPAQGAWFAAGDLDGEVVWIDAQSSTLRIGDSTTDLTELVGVGAQPLDWASSGDNFAILISPESGAEVVVLTTDDGATWDAQTFTDVPDQYADARVGLGLRVHADGEGRFLVPATLSFDRGEVSHTAVLAIDPDLPPATPVPPPDEQPTPVIGAGSHSRLDAPEGQPVIDAVGTGSSPVVLTEDDGTGRVWRWDGEWRSVDIDDARGVGRSDGHLAILSAPETDDGGAIVHISDDGGASWEAHELPIDAHQVAFARTIGENWVAVANEDGSAVRTYRLDATPTEHAVMSFRDGGYVLDEADGALWAWRYPATAPRGTPTFVGSGAYLSEMGDIPVDKILVPQGATWLGDTTLWLEGAGAGTRIRTSDGFDQVVDDLIDTSGFDETHVHGVRSWEHGFVILGSLAGEGDHRYFLLTSEDGRSWDSVDVPVPDGSALDPASVRLLDVDDTGHVLIDPGTAESTLLLIEPG